MMLQLFVVAALSQLFVLSHFELLIAGLLYCFLLLKHRLVLPSLQSCQLLFGLKGEILVVFHFLRGLSTSGRVGFGCSLELFVVGMAAALG